LFCLCCKAEATGCFIQALPHTKLPKLVLNTTKALHQSYSANTNQQQKEIDELTKLLKEKMLKNIEFFKINQSAHPSQSGLAGKHVGPSNQKNSNSDFNEVCYFVCL
jgi:hypothetical protein